MYGGTTLLVSESKFLPRKSKKKERLHDKSIVPRSFSHVYTWQEIINLNSMCLNFRKLPTKVYLIRHGETNYNAHNKISGIHDTKLSPTGERQAHNLSNKLPKNVDFIYSSDLKRSLQTASIFCDSAKVEKQIIVDPRLREINLGVAQGTRRSHWSEYAAGNIDYKPEGGESYREAALRFSSFLVDLNRSIVDMQEAPKSIYLFTHAGTLRIAGTMFLGLTDPKQMFNSVFKNTEILEVSLSTFNIPHFWFRRES